MLPSTPLLSAFAAASLVLALTPGPAVVYIVARTLAQGRMRGLASVFGVALGNFGNAIGAAVGLAALLTGTHFVHRPGGAHGLRHARCALKRSATARAR